MKAAVTEDPGGKMSNNNIGCCCIKNSDKLLKGSKIVAIIHAIGTIGMVAGLIYATINMDTVYKEVSQVNVNQLPYLIQNYIFPMKNNEVAEGQEAEKKGEEANPDNSADSFTVMKRSTTKPSSVSKPSKSQNAKTEKDDNKKIRKGKVNPNLFPVSSHTGDSDGVRRKRSNSKKSKKPMISQALATNVLIGIAVFHVFHMGFSVLLFIAASKKKWTLMIPWIFSEFFRQTVFLSLYGFIIYSSFPAITSTAVEDKIAKFQIPFLLIILLIIVSTLVLWGVIIGTLRDLHSRERQIGHKSEYLSHLFLGRFKKHTQTTVKTIPAVSAASTIPKGEKNSNQSALAMMTKTEGIDSNSPSADAVIVNDSTGNPDSPSSEAVPTVQPPHSDVHGKPLMGNVDVKEHYIIHNVGHAGGIWAW